MHFTLVFPVEAVPSDLAPEIAAVAQSTPPISFAIRGTKVIGDVPGQVSRIFMFLDKGDVQITALHDRLYAGALRQQLRSDIPFVPHLTVGAAPDLQAAEKAAEELGVDLPTIRGTLTSIEMVNASTRHVESVASYTLGRTAAT